MGRTAMVAAMLLWAVRAFADDAAPGAAPPASPPPTTSPPEAAPPPRSPFAQGRLGFGLGAASETGLGYNYFVIGASASYFVLDGTMVGLSGLHYFASDGGPSISKLSPELRYVAEPLYRSSPVVPYIGAFYSRWFLGSGLADVDTVGGRIGVAYAPRNFVAWAGVVYEEVISSCTTGCSSVYPDLAFSASF